MTFDPRSFILVALALGALCSVILLLLRRSLPKSISGIGQWASASLFAVAGAALFSTREILPVLFSSLLANLCARVRQFAPHFAYFREVRSI